MCDPGASKRKDVERPHITVGPHTCLIKIAETYFLDPRLAWLIADINSERIKETFLDGKRIIQMSAGQLLELPVQEDIQEFYDRLKVRPQDLITIVYR